MEEGNLGLMLAAVLAACLPWLALLFAPGNAAVPVSPFTLRARRGGDEAPETIIVEARGPSRCAPDASTT